LRGWRNVNVTTRRTKVDFAMQVKELSDVHYVEADRITLVMDNLNTHRLATLYEAFEPSEARRLIARIEVIHTPKHGSWLNMAECELSVLERQALRARVGDEAELQSRVTSWSADRNQRFRRIDWQFRAPDARIKLRRLYPQIQLNRGTIDSCIDKEVAYVHRRIGNPAARTKERSRDWLFAMSSVSRRACS